mmetsp:Transcript_20572/g.45030  ORF Transcript_20572/g.45030 Transcript_20572/m.45030 type:complete len:211 (+) Transcript_20572:1232-1864(+)
MGRLLLVGWPVQVVRLKLVKMDPHRCSPLDALDHGAASVHGSRIHCLVGEETVEQDSITFLWPGCNVSLGTVGEAHSGSLGCHGGVCPHGALWKSSLTALLHIAQIHEECCQPVVWAGVLGVVRRIIVSSVLLSLCVPQDLDVLLVDQGYLGENLKSALDALNYGVLQAPNEHTIAGTNFIHNALPMCSCHCGSLHHGSCKSDHVCALLL